MTASASSAPAPVAFAATAAPSPPLLAHATGPTSTPLTRVSLAFLEHRFKLYLRFGEPARTLQLDRWRARRIHAECGSAAFAGSPPTTARSLAARAMQAARRWTRRSASPVCSRAHACCCTPRASQVRAVLERIDAIEALGIAPPPLHPRTGARSPTGSLRAAAAQYTAERHAGWLREGAAMTAFRRRPAPRPRSRLRARMCSGLSLAASLRWPGRPSCICCRASYNPSDSVAVGWYRVELLHQRTDSWPAFVRGSIV